MGREVRRVPPNWEHPLDSYGKKQPMHAQTFEEAVDDWLSDLDDNRYCKDIYDWIEVNPSPESREYFSPFTDEEATWYQMWETVSEGTPVSPPFETQEELIEWIVKNGDGWGRPINRHAAEKFVKEDGWVPSMMLDLSSGSILSGVEISGRLK